MTNEEPWDRPWKDVSHLSREQFLARHVGCFLFDEMLQKESTLSGYFTFDSLGCEPCHEMQHHLGRYASFSRIKIK